MIAVLFFFDPERYNFSLKDKKQKSIDKKNQKNNS